MLTTFGINLST